LIFTKTGNLVSDEKSIEKVKIEARKASYIKGLISWFSKK